MVFCARCYEKHRHISHTRTVALAHPQFSHTGHNFRHNAGHGSIHYGKYSYSGHFLQRAFAEALLLTILTVLAVAALLSLSAGVMPATSEQPHVSYGGVTAAEPLQQDAPRFETTLRLAGAQVTLTSDTSYSINAKVESVKTYDDTISPAIPLDLLLAWGQMADPDIDSKLTWEQSDRRGTVTGTLGKFGKVDLTADYVINHVSNNHVIPADDRIRQGLMQIKPGDVVHIDGRLVDVRMVIGNRVLTVSSSKSRFDQGDGACEIIYVEHLVVNDRSY